MKNFPRLLLANAANVIWIFGIVALVYFLVLIDLGSFFQVYQWLQSRQNKKLNFVL